jgi:Flp pilus assembly protein TadG
MSERRVVATAWRRAPRDSRGFRGSRGSVAVEFALIVPLLVMLLMGTVTIGITYSRGIALTDAVRESTRFGATADASAATWTQDVISQERGTQIDDASQATAVCVQLWKVTATTPTPTGSAVASSCNQGTFLGSPALSTSDPNFPAVPGSVAVGTCVVRVLAARQYTVSFPPMPSFSGVMKRGAVARYERGTC